MNTRLFRRTRCNSRGPCKQRVATCCRANDYNRDVALDVVQLLAFLQATQTKAVDTLELAADGIKRTQSKRAFCIGK